MGTVVLWFIEGQGIMCLARLSGVVFRGLCVGIHGVMSGWHEQHVVGSVADDWVGLGRAAVRYGWLRCASRLVAVWFGQCAVDGRAFCRQVVQAVA